jgi:hypothetical protein
MLTIAMTAPTPMTMPNMVKPARSRFRLSTRNAVMTVNCIKATIVVLLHDCRPWSRSNVLDDLPILHEKLAGSVVRNIAFVCHQHNGHAISAIQIRQNGHDFAARRTIQIAGWFVGKEEGWASDQRPGNGHPLLLAAGKLGWMVLLSTG